MGVELAPVLAPAPTAAERLAARVMQLGAIAAVLAVSTHKVFELDRFLVPKELVLHATALLAGVLSVRAVRRTAASRVDLLLVAYLLLGALSAAAATNPWLGFRAFAVSASAVVLFWAARGLSEAGLARRILAAVAFAVVVAAVTSLLQAYGVRIELFALNRAPGGTLGNRNFVGHAAAFGLPVLMLAALRARRFASLAAGSIGVAVVSGALTLTRSRAAWVATAGVLVVFAGALIVSRALRRDGRTWRRMALLVLFAGGGVAAALLIPNTLRWRSDNPYLESVIGVAAYDEGSGRGRLIQYERSLIMAAAHPILGVGPGNWPAVYPDYAARRDPSLNPGDGGMTYNPWPSSDWVAFVSERGFAAAALLALAVAGIAIAALRRLTRTIDPDDALLATALLGTVAGAVLTGAFDAVLLLGAPAVLVWTALGALSTDASGLAPRPAWWRTAALIALIVVSAAGAARNAAQLVAMEIYATRSDRASLERAARIDPGNYRVRMRLARSGRRNARCSHALAARSLFPNAHAAQSAARGCGD